MTKTFVVLTIAALCAAIGDVFLSSGMRQNGPAMADGASSLLDHLLVVVRNHRVTLGVVFMGCFFYLYLASLSWADLSFAKPITSLSFVFSAILAAVVLGESVSWHRWIGSVLIVCGVFFVSFDKAPHEIRGATADDVGARANPAAAASLAGDSEDERPSS